MYDVPDEIVVEADGPIRIVRLNRPDDLNAVNHDLHEGLADLFPQISLDTEARAVVLTGNGRAFSAGGDFNYLRELADDRALRRVSIDTGKRLVLNMLQCRVPVVAAVQRPGRRSRVQPRRRCPTWCTCRRRPISPTRTSWSVSWPPTVGRSRGRCTRAC